MANRKAHTAPPFSHLLLILGGILILYLVVNFGRQVGVSYQRRQELKQIEQQIESARQEKAALEKALSYAQSPQAAEAWAREQLWSRPDEVPVMVVAPPTEGMPAGQELSEEAMEPGAIRDVWWDLFFGTR